MTSGGSDAQGGFGEGESEFKLGNAHTAAHNTLHVAHIAVHNPYLFLSFPSFPFPTALPQPCPYTYILTADALHEIVLGRPQQVTNKRKLMQIYSSLQFAVCTLAQPKCAFGRTVPPREERHASQHLGQDAAGTPNIHYKWPCGESMWSSTWSISHLLCHSAARRA